MTSAAHSHGGGNIVSTPQPVDVDTLVSVCLRARDRAIRATPPLSPSSEPLLSLKTVLSVTGASKRVKERLEELASALNAPAVQSAGWNKARCYPATVVRALSQAAWRGPFIVSLANTQEGSGKTALAAWLAQAAALQGARVLVVDLTHSARLARAMGFDAAGSASPGATLAGLLQLADRDLSGHPTSWPGVDGIGAGIGLPALVREHNGAFSEILRSFSASYDLVLLDLPATAEALVWDAISVSNLVICPVAQRPGYEASIANFAELLNGVYLEGLTAETQFPRIWTLPVVASPSTCVAFLADVGDIFRDLVVPVSLRLAEVGLEPGRLFDDAWCGAESKEVRGYAQSARAVALDLWRSISRFISGAASEVGGHK